MAKAPAKSSAPAEPAAPTPEVSVVPVPAPVPVPEPAAPDLFDRAKVGTRVVVLPGGKPPELTASAQPPAMSSPMANADGSVGRGGGPVGVPNQGPTVVPPLPAPVTVR